MTNNMLSGLRIFVENTSRTHIPNYVTDLGPTNVRIDDISGLLVPA